MTFKEQMEEIRLEIQQERSAKRARYCAGWRAKNQDRAYEYQKVYNKGRTASRKAVIDAAKSVPCADCKIMHPPYVMDFDHVRGVKLYNVGHLLSASIERIQQEIAKCDVVCSNCHRERTHQRRKNRRHVRCDQAA